MTLRITLLALSVALLISPTRVRAEIAYHQGRTLLAAITDGSDPFGNSVWAPLRQLPKTAFLNPAGAARKDGPPDVEWGSDGTPYVVWAYNKGAHHDIAFSFWTGHAWSTVEYLEAGNDNALDPRLHVESDGTVHAAWWIEHRQTIYTSRRSPETGVWSTPRLHAIMGKRPSISTFEGDVRVVFEVSFSDWDLHAIAVVRGDGSPEYYLSGLRKSRLDPVIHSQCGKLWIDYKASDAELGVLELAAVDPPMGEIGDGDDDDDDSDTIWGYPNPPWDALDPEPWVDPSWIGVEFSRRAIQLRLSRCLAVP